MEEQKVAGIHGTVLLFDNQIPELWEEFHRFNKKYLKTAGAVYSICETKQTTYTKDGNISYTVIVVKNWMARRILKFMSARYGHLMTRIIRLRFIFQ